MTKQVSFRSSPALVLLTDFVLVVTLLPLLPLALLPIKFSRPGRPVSFVDSKPLALLEQAFLLVFNVIAAAALVFSNFGGGFVLIPAVLVTSQIIILLQGGHIVQPASDAPQPTPGEAWFFVNGIATSRSGVKSTLARLSELFGRPVTGIHNRTYGLLGDLLECIIQRDLDYATGDIRVGYPYIKDALIDPKISKVILVAHSQGGIIASAWVDQLLVDISRTDVNKLEVYTFASAANHFSSPTVTPGGNIRAMQYVEHFANGLDPVSRLGVLAFASENPAERFMLGRNRFYGKVYERPSTTGHLLLEHYLSKDPKHNILLFSQSRLRQYFDGKSPPKETIDDSLPLAKVSTAKQ